MDRRTAGFLGAAAVGLLLAPAPPAAAEDPGPPGKKGGAAVPAGRPQDLPKKVNEAIAGGVKRLLAWQDARGSFSGGALNYPFVPSYDLGLQAAALYTLRACGQPAASDEMKDGFLRLRALYDAHRQKNLLQTYQVSLVLLALEAHHAPEEEPGAAGRYGASPANRRIPDADLSWMKQCRDWLVAAQTGDGSFGYSSPGMKTGWEDHSNLQFALLGLKAARRCGIEVPRAVFRKALSHLLSSQSPDGPTVARRETGEIGGGDGGTVAGARSTARDRARGWGYQCGGRLRRSAYGSMTAAGVSSLVICRGEVRGDRDYDAAEDARVVQAIRDGIAWLGHHFTLTTNPAEGNGDFGSPWTFYYLYGLERAGVMAGVTWMGNHDWYGEGAVHLLRARRPEGGWNGSLALGGARGRRPALDTDDLLDTCFALLFLKKATFRVEGAVATEESDGAMDLRGAADLDDDSFRAVFDSVLARYLRADAVKRAERSGDFVALGPRSIPHLIRTLEDEAEPRRAGALEILERVTGATHGYRAADPPDARAAAVTTWEGWWFSRRGRLVADPGAGRFR